MNEIELTKVLASNEITAPYFRGVVSQDQLNLLPRFENGFYVCNTDDSEGPGEHWLVVMWFDKMLPTECFDSLAYELNTYDQNITNFLINSGPSYKYSTKRIQSSRSISCGQFCIFYAYNRCAGYTFEQILDMFSERNLYINDIIVNRFVNNL